MQRDGHGRNRCPRAQEALRVHGVAADARLVVEMGASRAPGRTDPAYDGPHADLVALGDGYRGEVAVAARDTSAMIDLHSAW